MYSCVNTQLAPDRFNNPQSALYLNTGYCKVPPGVYFNGGSFTISAWVHQVQASACSRLLDFANDACSDFTGVGLSCYNGQCPAFSIWRGTSSPGDLIATCSIPLTVWAHLAVAYDGTNAYFYINGTLCGSKAFLPPNNVVRQNCFIGRSCWYPNQPDVNAIYDNIKIYNRSLTSQEIAQDMNQ
jgi:hypothetical protein